MLSYEWFIDRLGLLFVSLFLNIKLFLSNEKCDDFLIYGLLTMDSLKLSYEILLPRDEILRFFSF